MTRDRSRTLVSGPDAFGARRVLPPTTGAILLPAGTCPGCRGESHLGRTCRGLTTAQVVAVLRRLPGAISVELER
jgi:hypothetical protein